MNNSCDLRHDVHIGKAECDSIVAQNPLNPLSGEHFARIVQRNNGVEVSACLVLARPFTGMTYPDGTVRISEESKHGWVWGTSRGGEIEIEAI